MASTAAYPPPYVPAPPRPVHPAASEGAGGFATGAPEHAFPEATSASPWDQKNLAQKYPPLAEDTTADVVGE